MLKMAIGFLIGAAVGRAVLNAISKSVGDLVFGEDAK